jgi:membrane-associated phospholipid phosphatase
VPVRSPRVDPHAPSRRHTLTLAGLGAGSVSLLAALIARLDADEHWAIDHAIREAIAGHRAPRLRLTLGMAERAGTVAVYGPVTALAIAHLSRRTSLKRSLPIGVAVAGSAVMGFLLKQLVKRPRPVGARGPVNSHPSFPSGHASRATALVGALAYVATRERMIPRHVAASSAAIIALAAGVSRAYADAHWTTDVIAGWATGIASMAVAAQLYERVRASEHQ